MAASQPSFVNPIPNPIKIQTLFRRIKAKQQLEELKTKHKKQQEELKAKEEQQKQEQKMKEDIAGSTITNALNRKLIRDKFKKQYEELKIKQEEEEERLRIKQQKQEEIQKAKDLKKQKKQSRDDELTKQFINVIENLKKYSTGDDKDFDKLDKYYEAYQNFPQYIYKKFEDNDEYNNIYEKATNLWGDYLARRRAKEQEDKQAIAGQIINNAISLKLSREKAKEELKQLREQRKQEEEQRKQEEQLKMATSSDVIKKVLAKKVLKTKGKKQLEELKIKQKQEQEELRIKQEQDKLKQEEEQLKLATTSGKKISNAIAAKLLRDKFALELKELRLKQKQEQFAIKFKEQKQSKAIGELQTKYKKFKETNKETYDMYYYEKKNIEDDYDNKIRIKNATIAKYEQEIKDNTLSTLGSVGSLFSSKEETQKRKDKIKTANDFIKILKAEIKDLQFLKKSKLTKEKEKLNARLKVASGVVQSSKVFNMKILRTLKTNVKLNDKQRKEYLKKESDEIDEITKRSNEQIDKNRNETDIKIKRVIYTYKDDIDELNTKIKEEEKRKKDNAPSTLGSLFISKEDKDNKKEKYENAIKYIKFYQEKLDKELQKQKEEIDKLNDDKLKSLKRIEDSSTKGIAKIRDKYKTILNKVSRNDMIETDKLITQQEEEETRAFYAKKEEEQRLTREERKRKEREERLTREEREREERDKRREKLDAEREARLQDEKRKNIEDAEKQKQLAAELKAREKENAEIVAKAFAEAKNIDQQNAAKLKEFIAKMTLIENAFLKDPNNIQALQQQLNKFVVLINDFYTFKSTLDKKELQRALDEWGISNNDLKMFEAHMANKTSEWEKLITDKRNAKEQEKQQAEEKKVKRQAEIRKIVDKIKTIDEKIGELYLENEREEIRDAMTISQRIKLYDKILKLYNTYSDTKRMMSQYEYNYVSDANPEWEIFKRIKDNYLSKERDIIKKLEEEKSKKKTIPEYKTKEEVEALSKQEVKDLLIAFNVLIDGSLIYANVPPTDTKGRKDIRWAYNAFNRKFNTTK